MRLLSSKNDLLLRLAAPAEEALVEEAGVGEEQADDLQINGGVLAGGLGYEAGDDLLGFHRRCDNQRPELLHLRGNQHGVVPEEKGLPPTCKRPGGR